MTGQRKTPRTNRGVCPDGNQPSPVTQAPQLSHNPRNVQVIAQVRKSTFQALDSLAIRVSIDLDQGEVSEPNHLGRAS